MSIPKTSSHLVLGFGSLGLPTKLKSLEGAKAKDVFQEAFLIVWKNIHQNKIDQNEMVSLSAYLYTISKRKWVDYLRSAENKKLIYIAEVEKAYLEVDESDEKVSFDEPYYEKMETSFRQLGANCMSLLENFYFNKKSLKEIAIENKWTEATAKNNKYRCLQKLKKLTITGE